MKSRFLFRTYAVACVGPLLSLLVATACSLLNRDGPVVSCEELDDGTVNACEEGIIATCIDGDVRYTACDDPSACKEPWQLPGAYRCTSGEPLAAAFSNSQASNSNTQGTSAPKPVESPVSPNSTPGMSTPDQPSNRACDFREEPCTVASSSGDTIRWFTLDQGLLYFADCSTVWSVPKTGGFPTVLASVDSRCPFGDDGVTQDKSTLFFLHGIDLIRLAKTGGVAQKISGATALALASDDTHVYWLDSVDATIKSMTKAGGTPQTLAKVEVSSYRRLEEHRGYLYWLSYDGLARIPISGPLPAAVSTVPLGEYSKDFVVADTGIYFISSARKSIGRVAPESGVVTTLAMGESGISSITSDNAHIYWINSSTRSELRRVSVAGGAVTTIAWLTGSGAGAGDGIATDEQYVYWVQGSKIMRVLK